MHIKPDTVMACTDLETLAVSKRSVVAQIGLTKFTLATGITEMLRINVDTEQQKQREIDGGTVMWWLRQSDAARSSLLEPKPLAPELAIRQTQAFLANCDLVWARGSQFDLEILNDLYRDITGTVEEMISWRKWRDERPLRDLLVFKGRLPARGEDETRHDALCDAIAQTKIILEAFR